MKIALVSSIVPHVFGGGRFIVDWLAPKLEEHGHRVERIMLPSSDEPRKLRSQMQAFQRLDLSNSADRIVTFRPPAHLAPHPCKIVWFIHHFRGFYDLWQTPFAAAPDTEEWRIFRGELIRADTSALEAATRVYSNSHVVRRRLETYNGISSDVLYPPIFEPERFHCAGYGDEIVAICRMEHHKRQHLLVEAMAYTRTPVRLRLCGADGGAHYSDELRSAISRLGVNDRVALDCRWISEGEKIEVLANALAAAYVALDEDSYGYPTIEAAHSRKASVVTTDGGGVREFVRDNLSGLVVAPDPAEIAEAFDLLWLDRTAAARLGEGARERIDELDIAWPRVVDALTS